MQSRRQLLAGVVTASTVAIAGCTDVLQDETKGPEDAVEQYATAILNGDVEAANEALHPELPLFPVEQGNLQEEDFTIVSITQISTREAAELSIEQSSDTTGEPTEEEIQQEVERLEKKWSSRLDTLGADEYTFVLSTTREDGEEEKEVVTTVQEDGDWFVLI